MERWRDRSFSKTKGDTIAKFEQGEGVSGGSSSLATLIFFVKKEGYLLRVKYKGAELERKKKNLQKEDISALVSRTNLKTRKRRPSS